MKLTFCKFHGTGNDFILIDQRSEYIELTADQISALCNRHTGIGADGIMELFSHPHLHFEMKYYNSDGKEGSMCGNGGRCMVKYASVLGMVEKNVRFMAIDGEHDAILQNDGSVALKMGDVHHIESHDEGYFLDTGSPHLVKLVDDVANVDVASTGRKIRTAHSREGTNVNFTQLLLPGEIEIRTYERGVEDETLSCGTGAVASALAASYHQKSDASEYSVHAPGGKLMVRFHSTGNRSFNDIWLIGPAKFVFEGTIEI